MLFQFGPRSALLLLFVVPGAVATLWLLSRALHRGVAPDALLALLVLLPTLSVTQWMMGYAGWYDSHDWHSTLMFYVPWQTSLALGPAYYLYFRSLTNQEFDWQRGRHLWPGLGQASLWVGAAVYDLVWYRGLLGQPLPAHFGTQGSVSKALDALSTPLAWLGHALLLAYGLRVLADYRRYRCYLDNNFSDPERLRFAGLRQLLLLQLTLLVVNLLYSALSTLYEFSYDAAWYFFAARGGLIYGLIVVGVQANYAAATTPLRFGKTPAPPADAETQALLQPTAEEQAIEAELEVESAINPLGPAQSEAAIRLAAPPTTLPAELQPWRERLLRLMADERPWLEPELTLTELASRLRTHPALLSKVINAGCGQNFNDFVNTYRVQEARRKLADARFAHYSLVGVALESGFNSKSTFNRVFKKLLGQAPSEVMRPKS